MTAFNTFMRPTNCYRCCQRCVAVDAAASVAYIRFEARFRLPFASVANFTVDI